MNFGVIVHPFLYCFIINWINACIKKKKKAWDFDLHTARPS